MIKTLKQKKKNPKKLTKKVIKKSKRLIKKEIKHHKKKKVGPRTIDQAVRIAHENFRNNPGKIFNMPAHPRIKINPNMESIGYCIGVCYIRYHNGKIEKYMHEFGDRVILLYMKNTHTLLIHDLKRKLSFNPTNLIHDGQKL